MFDTRFQPAKKRSSLRVLIGWTIYNCLRSIQWMNGKKRYVKRKTQKISSDLFSFTVFTHKTPLRRSLKNEEVWMQDNKIHNLTLAAMRLNGIVIRPGETFSYWKLIGAPFKHRGYKKGMALVNGTVQAKSGGGLCQLSNLLYWMTLHTPLTVTERFRHSYDVFPDSNRTQPFGSGATCVYKYRDLQIKNDYVEPFRLTIKLENGFLHGAWESPNETGLTYEVYEKKHWISQGGPGIYIRNNILYRKCRSDQAVVEDCYITENHALMMYAPLIEVKD